MKPKTKTKLILIASLSIACTSVFANKTYHGTTKDTIYIVNDTNQTVTLHGDNQANTTISPGGDVIVPVNSYIAYSASYDTIPPYDKKTNFTMLLDFQTANVTISEPDDKSFSYWVGAEVNPNSGVNTTGISSSYTVFTGTAGAGQADSVVTSPGSGTYTITSVGSWQ